MVTADTMKKSFNNDYRKIQDDSYLLEVYDNIQQEKGERVPYHWHREPEVVLCYRGEVAISCNGETFRMKQDDILFINSSQIHAVNILPHSENLSFVFDLDSLISRNMDECDRNFLLPLKNMETVLVSAVISEAEYKQNHQELMRIVRHVIDLETIHPYGYQLELKGELFRLLYLLVRISALRPFKDHQQRSIVKNYEYMKDVLQYFEEHYTESIRTEELANMAHMSVSYFCKYFKRFTGNSPMDYLNLVRVENAARLLRMTDKKILDIAFEVGFQNFSYFSKVFKRYKNLSPSVYRTSLEIEDE